jgi:hypothetical protein
MPTNVHKYAERVGRYAKVRSKKGENIYIDMRESASQGQQQQRVRGVEYVILQQSTLVAEW